MNNQVSIRLSVFHGKVRNLPVLEQITANILVFILYIFTVLKLRLLRLATKFFRRFLNFMK